MALFSDVYIWPFIYVSSPTRPGCWDLDAEYGHLLGSPVFDTEQVSREWPEGGTSTVPRCHHPFSFF